jgi:HPt (histidine-containing phosphotransfer) domain-containing protein
VVGLTAHAMEEERERCLAAGMVAHLSKPVDVNDLVDILQQQLPIPDQRGHNARPGKALPAPADENSRQDRLPGIAVHNTLENLQCDLPTFKKILLTFYAQRRNNCKEIASLLAQGDVTGARELLHGIAGSSGYLGALQLCQAARAMEEACKTGDIDVVEKLLPQFRRSFEEVMAGLESLEAQGVAERPGNS